MAGAAAAGVRRAGGDRAAAGAGRADLDTRVLAEHDPGRLAALFAAPPAVHHCPQLMARQVQDLCRCLVARHGGQATAVWEGAENGRELLRRIKQLPGFGKQKSQILVALLGKRFGVCPPGWREAAGVYGEDGVFRSVADITGPESLDKVCTWQQETHRAEAAARRPAPRARYAHV